MASIISLGISYVIRIEDILRDIIPQEDGHKLLDQVLPKYDLSRHNESERLIPISTETKNEELLAGVSDQYNAPRLENKAATSLTRLASSAYDSKYYSQACSEALSDVRPDWAVLFDHATILQSEKRLSPVMLKFVQATPNHFEAIVGMVQYDTELAREDPDVLLNEAIRSYSHRRIEFAQACTEKYVLLTLYRICPDPTAKTDSLLELYKGDHLGQVFQRQLALGWNSVQKSGQRTHVPNIPERPDLGLASSKATLATQPDSSSTPKKQDVAYHSNFQPTIMILPKRFRQRLIKYILHHQSSNSTFSLAQ